MDHHIHYREDENPFIRMHTLDLRYEQIFYRYDLMGPKRLEAELKRSRNRMAEIIRKNESLESELEFQEMIVDLLKDFENIPELAYDRAYENCLEYVGREVVAEIMERLNKTHGNFRCPFNAGHIIKQAEFELHDDYRTEEMAGDILNVVVEENDVLVPHAHSVSDVLKTARQIFQKELTAIF